jgi:hypothetical protein
VAAKPLMPVDAGDDAGDAGTDVAGDDRLKLG